MELCLHNQLKLSSLTMDFRNPDMKCVDSIHNGLTTGQKPLDMGEVRMRVADFRHCSECPLELTNWKIEKFVTNSACA